MKNVDSNLNITKSKYLAWGFSPCLKRPSCKSYATITENSGLIFCSPLRRPCGALNADVRKLAEIQNQLQTITKYPNTRVFLQEITPDIQFVAIYSILRTPPLDVSHRLRPYKPCGVMRHPTNIWITAVDRGRGGGISSPRRRRGNWDIIQTNRQLSQACVSVYVGEVRVSIPFRLTSVIYSLPTVGRGYFVRVVRTNKYTPYRYVGVSGARGKKNEGITSHTHSATLDLTTLLLYTSQSEE